MPVIILIAMFIWELDRWYYTRVLEIGKVERVRGISLLAPPLAGLRSQTPRFAYIRHREPRFPDPLLVRFHTPIIKNSRKDPNLLELRKL